MWGSPTSVIARPCWNASARSWIPRWLTNRGRQLLEFEQRMAELAGTRHCIAMCNAIVARALELSSEVIMPTMTCVAAAHAVQWQGITPVFCDVDQLTQQIDVQHVESLITRNTTAIAGVHLWGRPCNIDALARLAEKHHLKLIFDAAHALGCTFGAPRAADSVMQNHSACMRRKSLTPSRVA